MSDLWERRARCEVYDPEGAPDGWGADGTIWDRIISKRLYLSVERDEHQDLMWGWVVEGAGPVRENHLIEGSVKIATGRTTYALDAMLEANEAAQGKPAAAYCAACEAWEALELALGQQVGGER